MVKHAKCESRHLSNLNRNPTIKLVVVEIDSVETDIGGGLVILPDELNDRSVNLAERCALQLKGDLSSFFINGQGGLPVWSRENYLPDMIFWEAVED